MSMFTHSAIASLNNLEMMVYNYVIKNRDKVMYMTIRELADAAGVSTTTILRFCRKLNCEGYSEFRVRFKLYLEQNEPQQANFGASEIISFFKSVNNEEFDALLGKVRISRSFLPKLTRSLKFRGSGPIFFPQTHRISLFRLFFPPFLALFQVFTEISPSDVSFGPPETGWPG